MSAPARTPTVAVTGANGLVGQAVCRVLLDLGASVRGVVRREGTAPTGVEELVGTFHEPDVAAAAVAGAVAVVTTVHPMGSDRATQHEVGVEGTAALAGAARDAGVERFVHVSTAAVYDRSPGVGDVAEGSDLVDDDGGDYPTTKRDAEHALAEVTGMTRVLLRPPAVLGPGDSSVWNTLRPASVREDEDARTATPDRTFAWVHVTDLARIAADVALGRIAAAGSADHGPVAGGCTPVTVAAPDASERDYHAAVCEALGVEPTWDTASDVWTGRLRAGRAHGWGWAPAVDLTSALDELRAGLA